MLIRLGDGTGEIWAHVQDDTEVRWVWAVVYPPSYPPPTSSEELEAEPLAVTLQPRGYGWYGGVYTQFNEAGRYRVTVYAQDVDGLDARPKERKIQVGSWVHLPLVLRNTSH